MEKENIQSFLIDTGRNIVRQKGTEALTVRKLSEASGCSVGAIYNQFANMDNFAVVQNYMTIDELVRNFKEIEETDDAFADLNNILQKFVDFVLANKNLWYLLYNFHLTHNKYEYSFFYRRKVIEVLRILRRILERVVPEMARPEQLLSSQVLWLCMFAFSAFLAKDTFDAFAKIDKSTVCQIFVNTYVVGLSVLEKRG